MFSENTGLAFWWRWGPAILIMATIFAFSSVPSGGLPSFGPPDTILKKGGHFLGYALLGLAFLHGIGRQKPGATWQAGMLAVLYAISDELHQSFVPGRGPWIIDVGIDAVGAFSAVFFARRKP